MKNQLLLLNIKEILDPYVVFAFQLGSFGTDRFHRESDIDLAVFYNADIDEKKKLDLWNQLEDLTERNVDLISLNQIDPIFSRQVIDTGKLLINHDPAKLLIWKSQEITKYIDFKMDRAIIEKNLLYRKKL